MVENKINEIWKPIKKEYFNKYNFYVSNLGRVKINDRLSKV
ncbi:NUMOD4 domain-containing protein, partial [Klebsiella pneumoniae]